MSDIRPIDRLLKDVFGFDRAEVIASRHCIPSPLGCGKVISDYDHDGWQPIQQKEYKISGICAVCQDKFFAEDD